MQKKQFILWVLLLLGISLNGQSQEVIPASGGEASGSGGSASYSAGQVVYTTDIGTSGSVTKGVQQPYEISVITGIKEAGGITLQISTYPNPATTSLTLKVANYGTENLAYQLFDLNGRLVSSGQTEASETVIDMNTLVPATYFLKVMDRNKEIKTFKIIKN